MAERSVRPGERLLAVLLLAAAAVVVAEGWRLDGLASPSASGAFPLLAGAVMAGSAAAIALAPRFAADALPMLPARVAAVMALLVVFAAAMPLVGFHLAAFAFLAITIRVLRGHGTLRAALIAALAVGAVHVVFRLAFTVLLPEGTLWR
ncbi:tripartite tricarboxylate transporter TctB family protein [Elioraea tepidiphila]|uniref:tripartite tricarboxylate transporter TctB family protein n=1 Tax=Elioraea tepidiphila TaxID=457934 RepID=UPI0003661CC3|nr:tripartite tricarboxylate transporter TctB family protein [Elioraea tepidiphila]